MGIAKLNIPLFELDNPIMDLKRLDLFVKKRLIQKSKWDIQKKKSWEEYELDILRNKQAQYATYDYLNKSKKFSHLSEPDLQIYKTPQERKLAGKVSSIAWKENGDVFLFSTKLTRLKSVVYRGNDNCAWGIKEDDLIFTEPTNEVKDVYVFLCKEPYAGSIEVAWLLNAEAARKCVKPADGFDNEYMTDFIYEELVIKEYEEAKNKK